MDTDKKELHEGARTVKLGCPGCRLILLISFLILVMMSVSAMIEGVAVTHVGQLNDGMVCCREGLPLSKWMLLLHECHKKVKGLTNNC